MARTLLAATAVLVIVLAAGAAAQSSCPAQTCSAGHNAAGGWKDCCQHDYKAESKCAWPGTPVSWTSTRTCTGSDGKSYYVLVQGNFQGPPSPSAECRCSNPTGAVSPSTKPAPAPIQMCVTLKPRQDSDIKGSDVACDGQSFCKVCGGLTAVQNRCINTPSCVALTFEPATQCGYLKSAAGSVSARAGWLVYSRA